MQQEKQVHRRAVVKGAAWTLPVIATAVATPLAASSGEDPEYGIDARAFLGYFSNGHNSEAGGFVGIDGGLAGEESGHYSYEITGTESGDQISDVYIEFTVSSQYPQLTFREHPYLPSDWAVPTFVGEDENGARRYRMTYPHVLVGQDGSTSVPLNFIFAAPVGMYRPRVTVQVTYGATVSGTPVVAPQPAQAFLNSGAGLTFDD